MNSHQDSEMNVIEAVASELLCAGIGFVTPIVIDKISKSGTFLSCVKPTLHNICFRFNHGELSDTNQQVPCSIPVKNREEVQFKTPESAITFEAGSPFVALLDSLAPVIQSRPSLTEVFGRPEFWLLFMGRRGKKATVEHICEYLWQQEIQSTNPWEQEDLRLAANVVRAAFRKQAEPWATEFRKKYGKKYESALVLWQERRDWMLRRTMQPRPETLIGLQIPFRFTDYIVVDAPKPILVVDNSKQIKIDFTAKLPQSVKPKVRVAVAGD